MVDRCRRPLNSRIIGIIHFGLNETKTNFPLYDHFTWRETTVVIGLCTHTLPYLVISLTCRQTKGTLAKQHRKSSTPVLPRPQCAGLPPHPRRPQDAVLAHAAGALQPALDRQLPARCPCAAHLQAGGTAAVS